ncbi:MAG: energy transducer TonB [Deltaproteobacteria bacterium]|nr:energy transducer TonB [Deltaproteobacteria bacterium]
MKPFFFTSMLFHGVLILLLFSWGIPLADKSSPKNIIEVCLISGEIENPKEKQTQPEKEKKKIKKSDRKETPAPIVPIGKEDPKRKEKEEEPVKNLAPEIRKAKEEPVLPQKAEPEEGLAKKPAPRDEHPFSPSPRAQGGSFPGGSGREIPGASLVAALNVGNEGGGIPIGIRGPNTDQGQGLGPGGKENIWTRRVQGDEARADETLLLILRKIEAAKKYPRMARRMGIEGKTLVRFKMRPNGSFEAVEILESSGSEILDKASLQTVHDAAPLPFKDGWLKVGIVFKIL